MSERPAIMDMTAEELRGAIRALRDLHAATIGVDAYSIRVMMQRDAAIAECILANAEEEDVAEEEAQEGLADAVADHLAQVGDHRNPPASTRVAPSAPAPESGRLTWTAERKALLTERYPEGDHEEDLRAALNAMPGIQISSALAVHRQAVKMGLKRMKRAPHRMSEEGLANIRAGKERAKMERASAAQPEPADGSSPDWDAAAEHEARTMLAAGRGARDLSHWFGGALTWWQAWCERERAGERRVA